MAIAEAAKSAGLGLHLDGARIWNASVATGLSERELAAPFDTVSVCFSKGLGAPVGSAQIQLMAPIDESSTIAKFLDKRGPGLQQLCYRTSDLDTLSERLREQGVRLLYDAPRRGTANARINFIHPKDAGGVLIELTEPAADVAH